MRLLAPLVLLGAGLATGAAPTATGASAAATPAPTLVGIRASHHTTPGGGGFDRIVFDFSGGLPTSVRAHYVKRLIADPRGTKVRIAGRAILAVRFEPADAHDAAGPTAPRRVAFPLPNVMTAVRSGDFEAVTTYGLGLAKQTPFRVRTLHQPDRVVVDVRAGFRTVPRKVWFLDEDNFVANQRPFFVPRSRPVLPGTPARGVLDRLFAGPLPVERAHGLRLLRSGATGLTGPGITDGVARTRMLGGCTSGGSTVTLAGEVMPTLRQFASVDWVKIYDDNGDTETPTGHSDSIPECLEP
ncbi:AMIN-like domain-containing (lipo)protein [Nocardioides sp. MAHUQ-72]